MSVFNNDVRSGYEEIKSYYPTYYFDVKEMDANFKFAGWLTDIMANGLELTVANQFVTSMGEEMITRMEVFLSLTSNKSRPLEERRKMVSATLIGFGKISGSRIKEIIKSFVDATVDISFKDEYLTILVARKTTEYTVLFMNDIESILSKQTPVHIARKIILNFNWPVTIQSIFKSWIYDFPICGTTPEDALIGAVRRNQINTPVSETKLTFDFTFAGDSEAGTYPEITTLGEDMRNSLSTNSTVNAYSLDYTVCGTKFAGEEGL